MFIHHVLFWLKPESPAGTTERLLGDCRTILAAIPGIAHLWAGPPAETRREVVDHSYAVGLCIVFTDRAAHDVYQTHAGHLKFIDRNRGDWDRVKIYDFEG